MDANAVLKRAAKISRNRVRKQIPIDVRFIKRPSSFDASSSAERTNHNSTVMKTTAASKHGPLVEDIKRVDEIGRNTRHRRGLEVVDAVALELWKVKENRLDASVHQRCRRHDEQHNHQRVVDVSNVLHRLHQRRIECDQIYDSARTEPNTVVVVKL